MRRVIVTAAVLAAMSLANTANAAWLYQPNEDPFSDDILHLAVGVSAPYSVGFRCTSDEDLELIYITPEKVDADVVDTLNALEPALLVRVDREDAVTIPAHIEMTNDQEITILTGNDLIYDLAPTVARAKQRVAFAIEIMGQRMHSHEMDVRGSTKALTSLLDACDIEE